MSSIAALRRRSTECPEFLTEQETRLLAEVRTLEDLAFGRGFDSGFDAGFQVGSAADSLEKVLRNNHELWEAMTAVTEATEACLPGRAAS